jgi:hypothetical protein
MLPLYSKTFPASATELAELLNASVQRLFDNAAKPVTVVDDAFPRLSEIRITLDGAELRANPPRPPVMKGASSAGIEAEKLYVNAAEVLIGPATANIRLDARDVRFDQAKDTKGEVVLMLKSATDGEVEVSADQRSIEQAIAAVAKQEAGKHGVAIDDVKLSVRTGGERSINAEVQLRAKKLFFTTTVRITAQLAMDEQLNARLFGLGCNGDGPIGAMACGFLQPHLQRLDGREFPLMALPLGDIRLRDVRVAAGQMLSVTAQFGA